MASEKITILRNMDPTCYRNQHMIDFVIMRVKQRKFCTDVTALRGDNCWTDNRMVRAKLRYRTMSQRIKGNVVLEVPLRLIGCAPWPLRMSIEGI